MFRFLRRQAGQTTIELCICVGVVGCAAWAMLLLSGTGTEPVVREISLHLLPLREFIGL